MNGPTVLCANRGDVVNVERGYQPPAARAFHAAVDDEQAGRLYILGGYNTEVTNHKHYYENNQGLSR